MKNLLLNPHFHWTILGQQKCINNLPSCWRNCSWLFNMTNSPALRIKWCTASLICHWCMYCCCCTWMACEVTMSQESLKLFFMPEFSISLQGKDCCFYCLNWQIYYMGSMRSFFNLRYCFSCSSLEFVDSNLFIF